MLSALSRPITVRAALRQATDATHRRMHRLEPFQAIATGTITAARYRTLLQSLHGFHSAVGGAARQHGWQGLSSAAERIGLLRSDIRSLGGVARPSLAPLQAGTAFEVLGALYAAEGSMLGGRVIARQLDCLFGSAQEGRRFFIGSSDGGARWRNLLAALETQRTAPGALDEAIAGALSAFGLFEKCVIAPQPNAIAPAAAASGMTATTLNFERHR